MAETRTGWGHGRPLSVARAYASPDRPVRRAANALGGVGGRHSSPSTGEPRTWRRPSPVSAIQPCRSPHSEGEARTYAGLKGIAEKAKAALREQFTALAHHLTVDFLKETFSLMNRHGAPGVDRISMTGYGLNLDANLADLVGRMKRRAYDAPPVRRVYIPKAGTDKVRPLGIPAVEDRLLQAAVARLLSAIYEPIFRDSSFGFRPGRSAHDALRRVREVVMGGRVQYVYEVDIRNFFGALQHDWLMRMLALKVGDPWILRLVRKWLKAGVFENGTVTHAEVGAPQGGPLTPPTQRIASSLSA